MNNDYSAGPSETFSLEYNTFDRLNILRLIHGVITFSRVSQRSVMQVDVWPSVGVGHNHYEDRIGAILIKMSWQKFTALLPYRTRKTWTEFATENIIRLRSQNKMITKSVRFTNVLFRQDWENRCRKDITVIGYIIRSCIAWAHSAIWHGSLWFMHQHCVQLASCILRTCHVLDQSVRPCYLIIAVFSIWAFSLFCTK